MPSRVFTFDQPVEFEYDNINVHVYKNNVQQMLNYYKMDKDNENEHDPLLSFVFVVFDRELTFLVVVYPDYQPEYFH